MVDSEQVILDLERMADKCDDSTCSECWNIAVEALALIREMEKQIRKAGETK